MTLYNYAFAPGWNVADGSLINPENRSEFYLLGRNVPPTSDPPDTMPITRIVLSGREYGDGRIDVAWVWPVLPRAALAYIITTFSLSSSRSALATIRTRLHEDDTYARYNAYIVRPKPNVDYTYLQGKYLNVRVRFNGLVAL